MSLFKFITLLLNLRIWLSEKWDFLFPIKEKYGMNKGDIEEISVINGNKTYEKILVKYEIRSKIYKIIYNNTTLNKIKKISIDEIPFNTGVHKPIVSIRIKYNKNEKRHVVSYLIPLLKEYKQSTMFIDFLIFNIKKKKMIKFYKIYIQKFNKKFCFKYSQLDNLTIAGFYNLLV
jgi:hypothetical protein